MTCGCGCIPTPASILQDDNIDVFNRIIDDNEQYAAAKRTALWARFKYRGIGSINTLQDTESDYDYWIQCMRDRYQAIKEQYDLKFSAWAKWLQNTEDKGISFDIGKSTSDTTFTHEDLPDTPDAASSQWLSTRDKNQVNYTASSGPQPAQARAWLDAVPNPSEDFAAEFDDYFYWGF